jgi:hypothetical protein
MSLMDLPPPVPLGQPYPNFPPAPLAQATQDADHLRLLSVLHYIFGGAIAFFSSLALIHIVIGLTFISHFQSLDQAGPRSPGISPEAFPGALFGYLFVGIGTFALLTGWTIGGLAIYSGRCIKARRKRVFSLIVAGVECLAFPFGTALGIFAFTVLGRPSVIALYPPSESPSGQPTPA